MNCREQFCKHKADVRVYGVTPVEGWTMDGRLNTTFFTYDFCNLHFNRWLRERQP